MHSELPYKPSFDAVFSCLSLHWVDDLPGLMMQARHLLKPDGLLLISLLGGNSLTELKQALAGAEQDITRLRSILYANDRYPDIGG